MILNEFNNPQIANVLKIRTTYGEQIKYGKILIPLIIINGNVPSGLIFSTL